MFSQSFSLVTVKLETGVNDALSKCTKLRLYSEDAENTQRKYKSIKEVLDPDALSAENLALSSVKNDRSRFTERMDMLMYKCGDWAKYMRHMREYWESLDETGKVEHSAIGEGIAEMDKNIKACHGLALVTKASEIESYAQSGQWWGGVC